MRVGSSSRRLGRTIRIRCSEKNFRCGKRKNERRCLRCCGTEMLEKRNALIRQAVRSRPELLEQAAAKIMSSFIRERLMEYDLGERCLRSRVGRSLAKLTASSLKRFCADLIAPVLAAYEAERETAWRLNSFQFSVFQLSGLGVGVRNPSHNRTTTNRRTDV